MKTTRRRLMELAGLTEQVLKSIKANTVKSLPTAKVKELFGSFMVIKSGPVRQEWTGNDYVIDLDVDALTTLLKSNKDYSTFVSDSFNTVEIFYKGNDSLNMEYADLPQDLVADLEKYERRSPKIYTIDIEIAEPSDGFELPEEYQLPTAIQSVVGKFPTSVDPENEGAYDAAIDAYLKKIENALLAAGKRVVPKLKKYAMEDGAFTFQLPTEPDAQTKTKLKAAFRGAKEVTV